MVNPLLKFYLDNNIYERLELSNLNKKLLNLMKSQKVVILKSHMLDDECRNQTEVSRAAQSVPTEVMVWGVSRGDIAKWTRKEAADAYNQLLPSTGVNNIKQTHDPIRAVTALLTEPDCIFVTDDKKLRNRFERQISTQRVWSWTKFKELIEQS